MTQREHDKIISFIKKGTLHGIDTGRLDGKCEDVISTEDAIDIVDLVYEEKKEVEEMKLDNFKKSEWIRYDYDRYKCKKCGCKMIHSLPTKHCPNCGRKMIDVIEKIGEEDD